MHDIFSLCTQLWVLDYIQEEEELSRRKGSSRKSLPLSESDIDPGIHGDKHLPVIQNMQRSTTPPPLEDIKEGMYAFTIMMGVANSTCQ